MSRVFLSHSSANNGPAYALRDWLRAQGWDDVFLDIDPTRGIGAGERWERALNEAAYRCEAVLFLVSKAWLKSEWCVKEFHLAAKLNKRMFGLLIEDIAIENLPKELTATWQLVNLAKGTDHEMFRAVLADGREEHVTFSRSALQRLKTGLAKAGLDPRFFAWPPESDPERPPYRGLLAMEAGDAGIFFGREAPIIEALDRLRGLRDAAEPRLLVILGASGAGKSSFLRAGLIPRLARDDRNFLVLPVIRPEREVLSGETGLQRSLELACKAQELAKTRAEINKAVENGSSAVLSLLGAFASTATPPKLDHASEVSAPSIILAIDQGEELFQAEGAEEAQSFFVLLRDLALARVPNLIVLFTIRSDSYERLQTAPAFVGIRQETLSLPPMPKGAYQMVIEGPAARLKDTKRSLKIEPQLTQALLSDIEAGGAKDALPLLAFTLERLYLEHGGDGDLKFSEYMEIGGINGSIEAAVKRALKAADGNPAISKDAAERLALMRRAFIPWLAGIDPDTGSPRRAISRLADIPEESRPLVRHLIDQRLLATDRAENGEETVEPAHEALLRQWGQLQGWLAEDSAQLKSLAEVRRAAHDWLANNRSPDWIAHAAGRLEDAERLKERVDLAAKIGKAEQDYLAACRSAENQRKDRELSEARKLARTRSLGLIGACVLATIAIGLAAYGLDKATEAEEKSKDILREKQTALYNEGIALSSLSRVALSEDLHGLAVKLALAAWPRQGDQDRPALRRTIDSLGAALPHYRQRVVLRGHKQQVFTGRFSLDGSQVITAGGDDTVRVWDASSGKQLEIMNGNGQPISSIFMAADGIHVASGTEVGDTIVRIWNASKGVEIATLKGHTKEVYSASFSPDGTQVVTTSVDETARLWDATTGEEKAVLGGDGSGVASASYSSDGALVVTGSKDGSVSIWDVTRPQQPLLTVWTNSIVNKAVLSPDGTRLVAVADDGNVYQWDAQDGKPGPELKGHTGPVISVAFSPDGTRIISGSKDMTARLWDAERGTEIAVLHGHEDIIQGVAFSADGTRVVTTSEDNTARVWDVSAWLTMAFKGHTSGVFSAVMSADGMRIVTGSWDSTARIWDVKTGKELARMQAGDDEPVTTVDISRDGTRVVTMSGVQFGKQRTRLWNAATGMLIKELVAQDDPGDSAIFSPDGALIVTSATSGVIRLWDAASGDEGKVLKGHLEGINSVAFSPDGELILTASADTTARLWSMREGKEIAALKGHDGAVASAAFSSDGSRIVTVSSDSTARIWDAKSARQTAVLKGDSDSIESAAFSSDGNRVATLSGGATVRLWDTVTGGEIAVLKGPSDLVAAPFFLGEDNRVVTASADNIVRVWDTEAGVEIAALKGHSSRIYSARPIPGGMRILTASDDGTARLWDLSSLETGNALAIACQRLGRETDLRDVRERYGLAGLEPICGPNAPLPVDLTKLQ